MKQTLLSILSLAVCVLCVASASAQRYTSQDAIRLKNKKVVTGTIEEGQPGEPYRIRTADGQVLTFPESEVDQTYKVWSRNKQAYAGKYSPKQKGYMGVVEVHAGAGIGDHGVDQLALSIINGYKFSPHFYLGFGTGLNYYPDNYRGLSIPFFGHIRTWFSESDIAPYFALDAGYNVATKQNISKFQGFLIKPALGLAFRVANNNTVDLGLGYVVSQGAVDKGFIGGYGGGFYPSVMWGGRFADRHVTHAIFFKLGVTF